MKTIVVILLALMVLTSTVAATLSGGSNEDGYTLGTNEGTPPSEVEDLTFVVDAATTNTMTYTWTMPDDERVVGVVVTVYAGHGNQGVIVQDPIEYTLNDLAGMTIDNKIELVIEGLTESQQRTNYNVLVQTFDEEN